MARKATIFISTLLFILMLLFSNFKRVENSDQGFNKTLTNDNYAYIAINQILMYISNNGDGSHDPVTDEKGFYWPGGINAVTAAIYQDGLIWGGKIGRETRVNGNTHRQGLQAGKILESGLADDASDPRYRVYKIRKGWEFLPPGPEKDAYQQDEEEWPVEDGAPWEDVDGDDVYTVGIDKPQYIGDEVLWYVANDLDESKTTFTYGTSPIGLEFQTTVFGFNRTGDLGDIVFKKYLIINKGTNTYNEMVFGYWSDTDLGGAGDDLTGCDTVLSLGYTYNADDDDSIYEAPVPAVGYDFFQGPIVESPGDSAKFLGKTKHGFRNIPLTAFTLYLNNDASPYRDPEQGQAQGSIEFYNYLTGLAWNGNPFIDPHSGLAVNFTVPGDPVRGIGWYEGAGWPGGEAPDDRRHVMASGSQRDPLTGEIASTLTLAPGDSQEIVVGLIIARGTDFLDSVTELKRKDFAAQIAFDLNFKLTSSPDAPEAYGVAKDRQVTIYWEDNAEDYEEFDQLLTNLGYEDSTYNFEGYRVWQFSDETGTDETLIGLYDVPNGLTTIYETQVVNGVNTQIPVINSDDSGLRRFLRVTTDAITGGPLRNGTPYFFAVTAYGYSPNSVPSYLENPPRIFEVRPGTQKIDYTYTHDQDDNLRGTHIAGDGHGVLYIKIVNPDVITADEYLAEVSGSAEDSTLHWTFVNMSSGDTLDNGNPVFNRDTVAGKHFDDGFLAVLQNEGRDSLDALPGKEFGVKAVEQVADASGPLAQPYDLIFGTSADGSFSVTSYGPEEVRQNINATTSDVIGDDNYEIRFTSEAEGSEYYTYGYQGSFRGPVTRDPKAANKVPFQIWNVGRDLNSADDDIRLKVKIRDNFLQPGEEDKFVRDSVWSQSANGNWEAIYGYLEVDSSYHDGLDPVSGRDNPLEYPLHNIVISGAVPEAGTVIRITPWRPVEAGDKYSITIDPPDLENLSNAKSNLDLISVFPNPYFGANALERDKYQKFVRFTNMPSQATVRIYTIAGVFVTRIDKDDQSQWLDWNLLNIDNLPVATGVYIAHLDMPGVGEKIMKIAIVQEKQIIDRL